MNVKPGLSRIRPAPSVASRRKLTRLAFEALETRRVLSAVNIPVDLTGEPSEQVVVPVQINDAENIRGVEIDINYDTELLDTDSDSVTAGSVWPTGSAEVVANVDDDAGRIAVWIFAAEGLDSGSGSLLEVEFTISSDALGGNSTKIDLAEVVLNEGEITVEPEPQSGDGSTDGLITFINDEEFSTVDLGLVDFTRLDSLDPSAEELWFQLETTHDGWLTVQAADVWTANELTFQLVEPSTLTIPAATSTVQDGTPRFDYEVQQGETYLLRVTGTASDASLLLANLIHEAGTAITVYGTDEADEFVFNAAASREITINGVAYHYEDTEVSTVDFTGGEGRDIVWLYDSPGDETLEAWPDRAVLTNDSGDGVQDYTVNVSGIEDLQAYARQGGSDSAVLHGSADADKFKSYEDYVRLRARNVSYTMRAKLFDTIVGDSGSGGKDVAVFNGSSGDDAFSYRGSDNSAIFEGQGRDHTATGFDSVVARSGGGENDVAHFTDIPETRDVIYLKSHKAQLVSDDLKITARTFDHVYATASESGFDVARIYDTGGDDHLEIAGDTARLYTRDGDSMKLLYEAVAFEGVKCYSTEGDDTTDIQNHEMELYLFGWEE